MEKRREPRVAHGLKFIARVHECLDDPTLEGESITCEAIDISSHGVRLQTDQALVPDTQLNITIGIGDPVTQYQLRGEIRWTEIIDHNCHMGVILSEADSIDFDAWAACLEGMPDAVIDSGNTLPEN